MQKNHEVNNNDIFIHHFLTIFPSFFFFFLATVILILTTGETLRQILLAAHDLNMGNGGYVFLTVELFKHANSFGNFDWFINGDSRNEVCIMIVCVCVCLPYFFMNFIFKQRM